METLFLASIALQFAVVVSHDWLDIPGWTHGSQVQSVVGRRKLLAATLINAIFPGLAVALAILYRTRPKPGLVTSYWLIYCAVTVLSALLMWYVPYLFGASDKTRGEFRRMYDGTRQILPARGDNPRPNLLHLCFHVLFAANLVLAMARVAAGR
jgi:hypothetical protein